MPWHRRKWAGPLLRLAGALLLLVGCRAAARLFAPPAHPRAALDYLLALLTIVTLSPGSALLTLGAHLFDPVTVAGRWQRRF